MTSQKKSSQRLAVMTLNIRHPGIHALVFLMAGFAALIASCASNSSSQRLDPGGIPLVGTYKVHPFVLDNGLKLLVVEDHSSPTFAYQTWFRVGSRDEVATRTGLAHLFEHLMFKATSNHPEGEFDRILEAAGAEGENAFTSWDYTAYVQELPKDKLELIASLESDRMVNLVVNDESFKTEREVVQNERRYRNENNPNGMMYQEGLALAFQKHSYHWPVIGYQEDLAAMTSEDPRKFYRSYYAPNHATIIVCGDVDPDQVLSVVKKFYGKFAAQETPPHEIAVEPAQTAPRRKQLKLNIQVEQLLMGYKIPNVMSEDTPTLFAIDALLTGGKSSRLNRALVDTGIASKIETEPLSAKDPMVFIIEASLQKGKKATQAESVILRELARLAKEVPSPQELDRAKNRVDFSFYESMDSNSERANFIGRYESISPGFQYGLKVQNAVQTVTPEQVRTAIQKYFDPKNRTVITGVQQ